MLIVVAAGGVGETKSIMRARDGVFGAATCEWLAAGLCASSPEIRRATRSAINLARSCSELINKFSSLTLRKCECTSEIFRASFV